MNQQTLAFFPYLCKEKNNDNIERDDGVRILLYLGSFCIYGWEMKDYETDHSNRKT